MKVSDFNYELPKELIAQHPYDKRDEARLMVLDRKTHTIEHKVFKNIIDYLEPGDCLVINNTKVIPARLYGHKVDTNASIEVLLLKDLGENVWECLAKPQKRVKVGTIISFGDGSLKAECIELLEMGICHFKLIYEGILVEILDKLGEMPLPPYIHEKLNDKDRYQTVYAKNPGSAAAPTAGLHFTKELLEKIKAKGVEIIYVTLHVGLGTFRPVNEDDLTNHVMHTEYYEISEDAAKKLNDAKKSGKRIISIGTTSTRTLESNYVEGVGFSAKCENTNIFIYPGYKFKAIDALITNFHLPKSTLIMLVSALAGREFILESYKHAVEEKYRFFSFGDAMFIK